MVRIILKVILFLILLTVLIINSGQLEAKLLGRTICQVFNLGDNLAISQCFVGVHGSSCAASMSPCPFWKRSTSTMLK